VVASEQVVRVGEARGLLGTSSGGVELLVLPSDKAALELWRAPSAFESFTHVAQLELASKPRRAAFLCNEQRALATWVDERAQLMLADVHDGKFSTPRSLAEGVDRRFAPALQALGTQTLLAFTRSVGDAMHVQLAHLEGERLTQEDLTPQGHGATAATFVIGQRPPRLVMIDAHAGVSPLLEVDFDAHGKPAPAVVRTPVSQPYAPPALQAAVVSSTRTVVAFTAIGRAAATAIGMVPLHVAEAASALVPSKGYGELALSAARSGEVTVFASEAFREPTKDAPRIVLASVVGEQGAGQALELGTSAASASSPSLVAGAAAGEFVLAYSAEDGLRVVQLVCAN
jgi:hypothetical protein